MIDFIPSFFIGTGTPPPALLEGSSQPALVLLSIAVAVGSAALALQMAELANRAPTRWTRRLALALGGMSLGGGVWAMHFIGMLSFQICIPVHYRPWATMASMLPSIGAAQVALWVLAKPTVSARKLAVCGVLMGVGIGLMHYGGMSALETGALLRYDPLRFALSILVAVALSILALWIRFGLGRTGRLSRSRTLAWSALVMGAAISGMHYTAMGAARFIGTPAPGFRPDTAPSVELALGIALVVLVTGGLAAATSAALGFREIIALLRTSEARLQRTLAEQRKVEAALVQSAHQHLSLIRNIPGVAFHALHDPARGSHRLVFVSEACLAMTGWSAVELRDGTTSYSALVHPDDRVRVLDFKRRRLDAHGAYGIEYRIRTRAGEERWVSESATVSPGLEVGFYHIDGIVMDITESRQRNAEFEGVVQALRRGVALMEFDMNGTILSVNERFLALTGQTGENLVGRPHSVLRAGGSAGAGEREAAEQAMWTALRRGQSHSAEIHLAGRSGARHWIQASYHPILDGDGHPRRVLKFLDDLSDRRAMEIDLREAKERAEQAAAAKSTFLANMSHEIRTPMNAIIGFSEVVLEGRLEEHQRNHVGIIHRSARSLLALLNDILDTAKLEQGAIELEAQPFSLRTLCADLCQTLSLSAERKGLALRLDYPAGLPDHYRGDALRIGQVLLNLTGNAVKFTERGSVTVAVRRPGDSIEISVVDTGIGISADRLDHIFEPFAQADPSMTRRFGGTGLGTTISRQLVQHMGGTIAVTSRLGEGSCFRVTMPLPSVPAPPEAREQQPVALPPLRVLVADDIPQNLELLALRLGRLGHLVTCAADGQQALSRLCAADFDLGLIDVQMPVMDGLEMARRLRADEQMRGRRPLPLIALTASVQSKDRRDTTEAGMDGFVVKPIEFEMLLTEMARVLATGCRAAAPVERPAVDWRTGAARWGDLQVYRRQLAGFVRDSLATLASMDPPPEAALAHRLRGVAANLALDQVVAAAAEAERNPHALQSWQALHEALLAVQADPGLQPERIAGDPGLPGTAAASGTLAGHRAGFQPERSAALAAALRRGELGDGTLDELLSLAAPDLRREIQTAVENFALDDAADLLERHLSEAHEPA